MSVLPAELKKSVHGERWAAELDRSLDAARTALARRKTLVFASSTLWIAILLSCLWVVLVRFTLFDVPQWPALLFPIAWLGLLVIIRRTRKVGVGESARFLDRSLDLDERVATSLEMVRSAPVSGLRSVAPRIPVAMLEDTTFHLKAKRAMMPTGMSYRLRRWQVYSLGACLVLLLGAIFLPTPYDQVRAERAELQRALNEQIANVEQLRAELIERPGLDADSKAKVDQELAGLLDVLTTPQTDRSAILAAIADTQERLHALSPETPIDFLGVVAAARTVQNATVAAGRNSQVDLADDTVWSPDALPDLSDLGKAADAAHTLIDWVKNLNSTQLRALATAMERAQAQAVPENALLAQSLLDTSESVAVKDVEKSTTNLQAVSNAFLDADKKWQLAGAVEKALADLDDGRQTLAKAGADDVKKGQVGFRRPGAPPKDLSNNAAGTPVAGGEGSNGSEPETSDGEHGVSKNDPSAFGQQMGSNSPDFSTLGDGQSSGDTLGESGGGSASSQNSSTGGSNDGQSGGSAGGGTGNSPGTFGGQSTGIVGGSGGAISQVKNPQGQGITTGADPGNAGEEVYIPPTYEPQTDGGRTGSDVGTAPDQTTPGESREGGLEGRAGENDGSTQTVEQRGVGVNSEIRTPYKEVYGDYAKQAGQALEGVYIPADAKDYVKEYFTELGK